jgi:hypothetical protein
LPVSFREVAGAIENQKGEFDPLEILDRGLISLGYCREKNSSKSAAAYALCTGDASASPEK